MFKIITTKKFNQMQSTIDELTLSISEIAEDNINLQNRINQIVRNANKALSNCFIRNAKGQIVKAEEVEL